MDKLERVIETSGADNSTERSNVSIFPLLLLRLFADSHFLHFLFKVLDHFNNDNHPTDNFSQN